MRVVCKSLFGDKASVGSHIVDDARKAGEDICIEHKGKVMTIPNYKLARFYSYGKPKRYPHKNGREGTYELLYIKFEEDQDGT